MTKMESPLAPICFVFQVSVNALASECMLSTSPLQRHYYEKEFTL